MLPTEIQQEMSIEQTPARLAAGLPAAPGAGAYADFYAFVESPFGMTPNHWSWRPTTRASARIDA